MPIFSMKTKLVESVDGIHIIIASITNAVPEYLFPLGKPKKMWLIYIQPSKRICTIVNGKSNFEI